MFNSINKKRCFFITGGAGFIGSHLVEILISKGERVVVYDNFSTGKKKNIEHLFKEKNFSFIKGDILDYSCLKRAMKGCDFVWHLAANTDIRKGNRETDWDLKNCTEGTRNVLEAMRELGIKNMIFSSTSTVYGDKGNQEMIEDGGPFLPICLYGAGKLGAEGFVSAYSFLFDIKAIIFRFGNVEGGRMEHGVVLEFIQKLQKNPKELLILGNGKQRKNFFLVEDCIAGMMKVFEKTKKQCEIYNLGNPKTAMVDDVAKIVVKEMGLKGVKFSHTGGKGGWRGDVPVVKYNINKAMKLGWKPKFDSKETVRIATQRLLKEVGWNS
jgi:UDP-glucose 4-epimerase